MLQRFSGVWRSLAVGAALALGVPSRGAAQCADELARKVFEAGHAYYEAGDYDEALRSFLRSYSLCPKPEQQKNIGSTHERLGNLPAAIEAYELYLRTAPPEAEDRDAIQVRISNLQKRLTPAAPTASAATSAPPAAPTATPDPAPEAPHGPPDRTAASVVLGASGIVAVGSLITGLLARSQFNEAERSCGPRCPDAEVQPIRRMALVSTVLTGAAALGTGVGAYLWWSAGPSSARTGQTGRTGQPGRTGVGVHLGSGGAQLGARWVF